MTGSRKFNVMLVLAGVVLAGGLVFVYVIPHPYIATDFSASHYTLKYLQRFYGESVTNSGHLDYPSSSLKQLAVRVVSDKPIGGYFVYSFYYGAHSGIITSTFHEVKGQRKRSYDFVVVENP
jgi:hypothetical protein